MKLTLDELNAVSGGAPSIGIAYGFGTDGTATIKFPDKDGTGYYTMSTNQNGVLWTHY
jgi:hypothetical protein